MTSALTGQLQQLVAEYQQAREQMRSIQDKMRSTSATVKSDKGMLTITVGPQGDITELKFNNRDYRTMAPPELAKVVTDTLARAKAAVHEQMREVMTPFMPSGTSFDDLRSGKYDWASILPAEPMSQDALAHFAKRAARLHAGQTHDDDEE